MHIHINIIEQPEIVCAGIRINTSMDQAHKDCSALWEKFCSHMASFPANPEFPDQSFGVSIMIDEISFTYWAVMPLKSDATIPEGMDKIILPAGPYAETDAFALKDLGDVYSHLYGEWIKTQPEYTLDMRGACYEKYTSDFAQTSNLVLYCPLSHRASQ